MTYLFSTKLVPVNAETLADILEASDDDGMLRLEILCFPAGYCWKQHAI